MRTEPWPEDPDAQEGRLIISAQGHNVRNALAEARRVAGLSFKGHREVLRSGGEDGCYRVHLECGTIVEVTLIQHVRSEASIVE